MPEFTTATGSIYYEVIPCMAPIDQPTTLTLLHNFMSTGRSAWGPLLEKLAQRFRLLLPDLPGHGRSQGYPTDFRYRLMAEQVAALMAAEHALTGHVAGCSAGGMIAQLLVHHGLAQPASLTLVSTAYSTAPDVIEQAQSLKPENYRAGRRWMEATAQLHDPFHYPGYYERVLLEAFRRLGPDDTIALPIEALRSWPMPVCLIHGAADEFFPAKIAERMAATLPNAEYHLIPDQPHALIFRQPWKVAELMDAFFNRHTSTGK